MAALSVGWRVALRSGTPVSKKIHHLYIPVGAKVVYEREIAPDPAAPERMVVSQVGSPGQRQICLNVVGGRFGAASNCWPAEELFSNGPGAFGSSIGVQTGVQVSGTYAPFNWIAQQQGAAETPGSNQYDTIAGLTSDTVSKLRLYLGNGQIEPVPLHNNGYIVEAPTVDYPLRLVAYDKHDTVIGIVTLSDQTPPPPVGPIAAHEPAPNATWRRLIDNSIGYVFAAPATDGGTCYATRMNNGGGSLGCRPPLTPGDILLSAEGNAQEITLTIVAGPAISQVAIHYSNGHIQTVATPKGVALVKFPANPTGAAGLPAIVGAVPQLVGLDAKGQTVSVLSSGTITSLTPTKITLAETPPGTTKRITATCALTASSPQTIIGYPSPRPYREGDPVRILCANGNLTSINLSGQPNSAPTSHK